ncbi:MAG: hypothetical protein IJY13_01480 [Clostridia bacterium]|nr:hypothetical protein [Clostridia bacterium]
MTANERNEIDQLPEKYRPLSAWGYWGLTILYSIPVLGTLCLIIHALSGGNINRRSFARSYFCTALLVVIVVVAFGGLGNIMGFIQGILDFVMQK